ncbi:MAG: ADP-ribosylglycohydrolase family protein [Clostridia bacterium]|nr:ADP-ribosylglycohydrolase family protein [Clostridia bacterium]
MQKIIRQAWPDWELIGKIGAGSFGTVYKARRQDMAGTSYAAIKVSVIPRDSTEMEELRAEGMTPEQTFTYYQGVVKDYSEEIKLMNSVHNCKNIVALEDYKILRVKEQTTWYIFIRMELLTPLVKKVAETGMQEKDVIKLGIDLCNALDICSKKNIVHRDIKPDNIFVNEFGDYKLGDFGVARNLERMTMGMSMKGTPNYMAPEVYKSLLKQTDFAAACKVDIYSLGMVLYWLTNGSRLPFLPTNKQIATADDRQNALFRRMGGEELPPPYQASPALQRIILKACAYDARDRYQSAREMMRALQKLADQDEREPGAEEPRPDAGKPDNRQEPASVQPHHHAQPPAQDASALAKGAVLLGAIAGDIAGSRFERHNYKGKDFEMYNAGCAPTDDTNMTLAIAQAIVQSGGRADVLADNAVRSMQALGREYPYGFGQMFADWVQSNDPQPYHSSGNGAAMRVSPCAWAASTLEEALMLSDAVTRVTHNHPEAMKGARAVTAAIFLARQGKSREQIRDYIWQNYYPLNFSLSQIRDSYQFDVSCQGSVPQAIQAFLEATSFEDAIRNAVSIGGDSDTIAAIAGSIAEAHWGVPVKIREQVVPFLDARRLQILNSFTAFIKPLNGAARPAGAQPAAGQAFGQQTVAGQSVGQQQTAAAASAKPNDPLGTIYVKDQYGEAPAEDSERTVGVDRSAAKPKDREESQETIYVKNENAQPKPRGGDSTVGLDRDSGGGARPSSGSETVYLNRSGGSERPSSGSETVYLNRSGGMNPPDDRADTPEKKKHSGLVIFLIVLLVLAAACAGVYVYQNFIADPDDEDSSPTPTATKYTVIASPTPKSATSTPKPKEDDQQAGVGIPGDVTGDGKVDIMDVIRLQKHISGWPGDVDEARCDTTGDGIVNVMDVIRLQKHISGWNVQLH